MVQVPTSRTVDPATSVSTSAKGLPDPLPKYHPWGRHPAVDEPCLEGCPVPQLLAQPFLFSHVGRSSRDLLRFPGQKSTRRDKVWPAPSAICCFCFPLLQREEAPPPLGKGCGGASPFPAVPPGCPRGLPPTFFSPRLMLPGEVLVWFHREDTSQLGTIWSPSEPTLCSRQGLRS